MLPKFEYGHLYKFAVSLGLLLMAAAVVLPWLILRESSALLVPVSELHQLTPIAQEVIGKKQRQYSFLTDAYPFVSASLLAAGAVIAGVGMRKWADRQAVADSLENAQRDTVQAQLRQLSPAESDEKLTREAEEVLAAETAAQEPSHEDVSTEPAPTRLRATELKVTVGRIESLVTERLSAAFSRTHDVRSEVQFDFGGGDRRVADDVLLARDPLSLSLAIEVKYVRSENDFLFVSRYVDWASRVAAAVIGLQQMRPTRAAGVVLAVTETDIERTARIDRAARRASDVLSVPVVLVMISREALESGPADHLRLAIEAQLGPL